MSYLDLGRNYWNVFFVCLFFLIQATQVQNHSTISVATETPRKFQVLPNAIEAQNRKFFQFLAFWSSNNIPYDRHSSKPAGKRSWKMYIQNLSQASADRENYDRSGAEKPQRYNHLIQNYCPKPWFWVISIKSFSDRSPLRATSAWIFFLMKKKKCMG